MPPFTIKRESDGTFTKSLLPGTPENIKSSCQKSLERLNTDYIDLYY